MKISSRLSILIALLISALLLIPVAGCAPAATPTSTPTTAPTSEPTPVPTEAPTKYSGEIIVATGQPPGYAEAWAKLAEAYKAYQPDVTITLEPKPMDGYAEWLSTLMKSGDVRADIVNTSAARDKGEWIDWKDYLDTPNPYEDGRIWSEILPVESQIASYQNKIIALTSERTKMVLLYNKDIFAEAGVDSIPKTWDEFGAACDLIQKAGYIPISLAGDNASFQYGQFSYFELVYTDQYQRDKVPLFAAQPGDFDYDEEKDGYFQFDIENPFSDYPGAYTSKGQRALKAIRDKTWRFDGPDIQEMYENLKEVFPKYVPPGWAGVDGTASVGYFMRGEAAILPDGCWRIIIFNKDKKDLANFDNLEQARKDELQGFKSFNLGMMPFPSMTGQYVKSPARDYELGGADVGAVKKTPEHDEMVVDFMKYYLSTEGFGIFYNEIFLTGNFQYGVPIIQGIEYVGELQALDEMENRGNAVSDPTWYTKQCYGWVEEAVREYAYYTLDYFSDKITISEFLAKHQSNFETFFDKAMEGVKLVDEDLDNPHLPPISQGSN